MKQGDFDTFKTAVFAADDRAMAAIYKSMQPKFIAFQMKSFHIEKEEALNNYHRAFISLYEKVQSRKLKEISSSFSAYLIGIGKFQVLNDYRDQKKFIGSEVLDFKSSDEESAQEKLEVQELTAELKSSLEKLSEKCKEILLLFYFRKRSMKDIALALGYKDERVSRKKKSLCLKSLRAFYKHD